MSPVVAARLFHFKGSRGPETSSSLPKVTQQEITGTRFECRQPAQQDPVSGVLGSCFLTIQMSHLILRSRGLLASFIQDKRLTGKDSFRKTQTQTQLKGQRTEGGGSLVNTPTHHQLRIRLGRWVPSGWMDSRLSITPLPTIPFWTRP